MSRLILSVVLVAACQAAPVRGQEAETTICDESFPAPVLCARAGLDSIQANFVLLVDQSGSMAEKGLWRPTLEAIQELADAVPAADQVRLVLFAGEAREHQQPWGADAETRERWKNSVATLPGPSGAKTDLGRALEEALDIVQADPPTRQQFVLILTDGTQDPPPDSPYDEVGQSNAWEQLRNRASIAMESRPLSVTLLRVHGEADQRLLAQTVPGLDQIDAVGSAALSNWVQRQVTRFQIDKLLLALRQEESDALAVVEIGGGDDSPRLRHGRETSVEGRVESGRQLTDLELEERTRLLSSDERTLTIRAVEIPPDGPMAVDLTLRDATAHPLLPPGWKNRVIDTVVTAQAVRGPSDELGDLAEPAETEARVRIQGSYQLGGVFPNWPTYIAVIVMTLGMLSVCLVILKWKLHRPRLDGWTLIRRSQAGRSESEPIDLKGKSFEAKSADGNDDALFLLLATSHRGETRVQFEPKVPREAIEFNRPSVDPGNLKNGTRITVSTSGGKTDFQLMRRGSG